MAGSYKLVEDLIHATVQVANFQKNRLEELVTKDFPFAHSKLLINVLLEFDKEIIEILANKETEYTTLLSQEDYENLIDDLLSYMHLIWELNRIVHFVERSAREHVAESTVILLGYLTRQFGDSKFFLVPMFEHNYSYRNLRGFLEKVAEILPNTGKILSTLPQNFAVLSFPDIYRDNIVANSLLAHEVGHFINEVKQLTAKLSATVQIDEKMFGALIEGILKSLKGTMKGTLPEFLEIERLRAELLQNIRKSIESWITELLSDLIAFRLCGPVFLLTLSELLLTRSYPAQSSDDYPSPSLRLTLLIEEFRDIGYVDSVDDRVVREQLKNLVQRIKDYVETSKPAATHSIINKAIQSIKEQLKKEANDASKGIQYEPSIFSEHVVKLIGKLRDFIPPAEIRKGVPANVVSILNAGMIYRMTWRDNKPSVDMEADRVEQIINSLVSKSIELSVIQSKLQEQVDDS